MMRRTIARLTISWGKSVLGKFALAAALVVAGPLSAFAQPAEPSGDQAIAERLAKLAQLSLSKPDLGDDNFRQAAALLRHCQAFLSVDTALMHLAAAVKVPNQIVIEAMTLNATNVPYGNLFKLVPNPAVNSRNLDYYRYDGRPIKGTDRQLTTAMNSVKVEAVQLAVATGLGF